MVSSIQRWPTLEGEVMTVEEEAGELILALEGIVEQLRTIENGKNYTSRQASEQLYGIRLSLVAEAGYDTQGL